MRLKLRGWRRAGRPRPPFGKCGWPTTAEGRALLLVLVVSIVLLVFTAAACGDSQSAVDTSSSSPDAAQGQGLGSGRASSGRTGLAGGSATTPVTSEAAGSGSVTGDQGTVAGSSSSATEATSATGPTSPTEATSITQSTTTTLAAGSYSDGVYLVGTDIASGLYKGNVSSPSAHWELSWDANGEKFIAAADPVGQFYVKVSSGQYLRLQGVIIAKASSTPAESLASRNLDDGTYRVGYDIAAGWYTGAPADSLGYWEITSDANGQSLVASDYVTGPFRLKVKSGQYLTLRGVTVSQ